MQAFEETADMNGEEMDKNEKVLEEFENQSENEMKASSSRTCKRKHVKTNQEIRSRCKSLERLWRRMQAQKLGDIYLGLMSFLAIVIANAVFATTEVEWGKVAALVFIFMGLLVQFIYERSYQTTSKAREKNR